MVFIQLQGVDIVQWHWSGSHACINYMLGLAYRSYFQSLMIKFQPDTYLAFISTMIHMCIHTLESHACVDDQANKFDTCGDLLVTTMRAI